MSEGPDACCAEASERLLKAHPSISDTQGVEKLLGAGVLAMVLACTVVGVRMLWLWARTRKSPELLLGAAFVLLGAVGYPLAIVARGGSAGAPSPNLLTIALGAQNLACVCMYAATWQTFHGGSTKLGRALAVVAAAFALSLAASAGSGTPDSGPWYYLGFVLRAGAFGWAAWESWRYHELMRLRLGLGLVDPVVVDRFRLWTISTIGIVLGFAVFLAGRLATDNVGASPWVLATTSLVSLVSATAMWLAFAPPAAYLHRVRARAASVG